MDPYVQPQCGHRILALEGENYIRALLWMKFERREVGIIELRNLQLPEGSLPMREGLLRTLHPGGDS